MQLCLKFCNWVFNSICHFIVGEYQFDILLTILKFYLLFFNFNVQFEMIIMQFEFLFLHYRSEPHSAKMSFV